MNRLTEMLRSSVLRTVAIGFLTASRAFCQQLDRSHRQLNTRPSMVAVSHKTRHPIRLIPPWRWLTQVCSIFVRM